jgi:hypothetical protein
MVLKGNSIQNLEPIEKLVHLFKLESSNNNISEIASLAKLRSLNETALSHNKLVNVCALASLDKLSVLDLSYNKIGSTSCLATLVQMRLFKINNNQIDDERTKSESFLQNMNVLRVIYLQNNTCVNIEELARVERYEKLSRVHLSMNHANMFESNSTLIKTFFYTVYFFFCFTIISTI